MKTAPAFVVLGAAVLLSGCGDEASYMPLAQGTQWSYTVYDSAELPTQIEVVKPARVGKDLGWELMSPHLGPLTLAWQGPQLKSSLLSGTTFDPPLILLDVSAGFRTPDKEPPAPAKGRLPLGEAAWSGRLKIAGEWHEASAHLVQTLLDKKDPDKKLARSEAEGCRVALTLTWGEETREILTSYVRGRGIIRQTSRSPDKEGSVSLVYLNGPLKVMGAPARKSQEAEPSDPQADPATQAEPQSTPQGQKETEPGAPATGSSPT